MADMGPFGRQFQSLFLRCILYTKGFLSKCLFMLVDLAGLTGITHLSYSLVILRKNEFRVCMENEATGKNKMRCP